MEFRILGPVEVDIGSGCLLSIPPGGPSLLALLLVHRGAVVPVDRVVDELWVGEAPENPQNAVQVIASRLRKRLGDGALVSQGGGYALPLPPGALDAQRFEELLTRGQTELSHNDPAEAAATFRQGLEIWRGPALADVRNEPFAQPEIARLEDLRLACVYDRIEADLVLGRHDTVVGELEALVAEHPLHERLRGQLMVALYQSGRQADALTAYRDARRTLVVELGIEPSPSLSDLALAILRHTRAVPAADSNVVTGAGRSLHQHVAGGSRASPPTSPARPAWASGWTRKSCGGCLSATTTRCARSARDMEAPYESSSGVRCWRFSGVSSRTRTTLFAPCGQPSRCVTASVS